MINKNNKTKYIQIGLMVGVFGILVIVITAYKSISKASQAPSQKSLKRDVLKPIPDKMEESLWRVKMEEQRKEDEQKTTKEIVDLKKMIKGLQGAFEQKLQETNKAHETKINTINEKIKKNKADPKGARTPPISPVSGKGEAVMSNQTFNPDVGGYGVGGGDQSQQQNQILEDHFEYEEDGAQNRKTVEGYIPAGSFVHGVMETGVTAPMTESAAQNPVPVRINITDNGFLPNALRSKLKKCVVIGAAYGDFLTEKIMVRPETLSCVEVESGEIIETKVGGVIYGPDGKNGLRGRVVGRDSKLLTRAAMAGVFGGIANVANPQNRQDMINPFSAGNPSIKAPSVGKQLTSGLMAGGSTAMDKMSDYYLKMAEKIQGFIELDGGAEVDVLFNEGVRIGDTEIRRKIHSVRNQFRERQAAKLAAEQSPFTLNQSR